MSTSRHLDTSITARLSELRREREAAEAALPRARAELDIDQIANLKRRIETITSLERELDAEHTAERETEARRQAEEILGRWSEEFTAAGEEIGAAQDAVRSAVVALAEAIKIEAELRESVQHRLAGAELMAARFGLTAPARASGIPPVDDYAREVLRGCDRLLRAGRRRRLVVGGVTASTPDEERRRRTLEAVARHIERYGAELPEEIRAILESAPVEAGGTSKQRGDRAPDAT